MSYYEKYILTHSDAILSDRSETKGIMARCDIIIKKHCYIYKRKFSDKEIEFRLVFIRLDNDISNLTYFANTFEAKLSMVNQISLVLGVNDATYPNNLDRRYRKSSEGESKCFYNISKHPKIKKMYVMNLDTLIEGIHPLPIGLNAKYAQTKLSYYKNFDRSHNLDRRALRVTFCNRTTNKLEPQLRDRFRVKNICRNSWKKFCLTVNKEIKHNKFIRLLVSYPFTICVHGGGIDLCPKLWEALLVGTIPIIEYRESLAKAYEGLPIVYVDSWNKNSISIDKLKEWLEKFKPYFLDPGLRKEVLYKLSLSYWMKKIVGEE